jgi:hypothetical protein
MAVTALIVLLHRIWGLYCPRVQINRVTSPSHAAVVMTAGCMLVFLERF